MRKKRIRLHKRAINAKKYWGIGVLMKKYEEILRKVVDLDELEEILRSVLLGNEKKEVYNPLNVKIGEWLTKITTKIKKDFGDVVANILIQAFLRGSKRLMDVKGRKIEVKKIPDTAALVHLYGMQSYYVEKLGKRIANIIFEELEKGIKQGLSYEQIIKNIRDRTKRIAKAHIQTIVRTELVKAHNKGMEETMKEVGVERYFWVTQNDRLVCEKCKEYEKESLKIGGYRFDDPTSPRPVRNSHPNCRCVIVVADKGGGK